MRTLDWIVLVLSTIVIIGYGMYRGRGSRNIRGFFLADKSMKWYAVALSIMATQASAVTFISTPGLAYVDGMRFIQFYLGLPIAMIILSISAVPIFHKLNVYTAYEYLERRFDLKTRVLTSILFLIGRGLGVGMSIFAPSLVLSVILGWDLRLTSAIIGGIVITYTATGGVKAVMWTHVQQMIVIMAGMLLAFAVTVSLLPQDISVVDALTVAGGMGRLNPITYSFNLHDSYNLWSGLIGGMFVALAYFGCDHSQVQRYLTGQSVTQSRLGLLFNGIIKVPMQFLILLLGVMVFVFYQFTRPPLDFNPVHTAALRSSDRSGDLTILEAEYARACQATTKAVRAYLEVKRTGDVRMTYQSRADMNAAYQEAENIREKERRLLLAVEPAADPKDTNYIFLSFVTTYLPAGIVGLVLACIFFASMSSSSGELTALATISVVDVYQRLVKREGTEYHYLTVARVAMVFWGVYAVLFAQYASRLGSLVEAVNNVGSLFYGTMLGVFLLAFFVRKVRATPVFWSAVIGESVVLWFFQFTEIFWLWYNVIGCVVVLISAIVLDAILPRTHDVEH